MRKVEEKWGHHIDIITKCNSIEEALFYIYRTVEEGWSRSTLQNYIKSELYRRTGTAMIIRTPDENPTIGLLICKDKDQTEVQWAFQGIQTPMGVASYDNIKLEEIKKQLPTEEQIQQRIELAEEEFNLNRRKKK